MNSLKTMFLALVLGAVGYGVYVSLGGGAADESAETEPAVEVSLPGEDTTTASAGGSLDSEGGAAPRFVPAGPASGVAPGSANGEAPRYQPSVPADGNAAAGDAPSYNATAANTLPAGLDAPRYPRTDEISHASAANAIDASLPMDDPREGRQVTAEIPANDPRLGQPGQVHGGGPGGGEEFAAALAATQQMLAADDLDGALVAMTRWYGNPRLNAAEHQTVVTMLNQLAGTVIYSRQHRLEAPYEVQPGDTPEMIAEKYQVPWQLLANINGMKDQSQPRPGQQLKVIRGPFDAVAELASNQLTLMVAGRYAGSFRFDVGRDQTVFDGEFEVTRKDGNPTYYGTSQVVAADDPNNPLGEFLLQLSPLGTAGGGQESPVCIHGSNGASRGDMQGWIRLSANDAEDVFGILTVGSRVTLRR